LGVSMAWSFASTCSSELKAAIDNPLIISFGFLSLVLRNYEHYYSGRHLLDKVSSTCKLRLCGFLPWLVQAWIGVTSLYKPLIGSQTGARQR
jgi:hypothetical protein